MHSTKAMHKMYESAAAGRCPTITLWDLFHHLLKDMGARAGVYNVYCASTQSTDFG
jgi:hypothetical protein